MPSSKLPCAPRSWPVRSASKRVSEPSRRRAMRLELFFKKQRLGATLITQIVRFVEGFNPDIVRLFLYRKEFFGELFQSRFHETLRAASDFTPGERELMAAF